jgi:hypothetical protein
VSGSGVTYELELRGKSLDRIALAAACLMDAEPVIPIAYTASCPNLFFER